MPLSSKNRAVATALCAGVISLAAASGAHAQYTSLPPGGVVSPVNTVPQETTAAIASLITPFAGVSGAQHISGTLISAVFTPSAGVEDFLYQLVVDPSGPTSDSTITGINAASFRNFTTLVGQAADGDTGAVFTTGTDSANNALRSADGEGVQFNFSAPMGTRTFTFFVRTNATTFVTGSTGILASGVGSSAASLAPNIPGSSAPEPGSIALTAFGMIGMIGGVAARRKKAA